MRTQHPDPNMVNIRNTLQLFATVVISWVIALVGRDTVRDVGSLFPLANSAHPYFVPDHAFALYLWSPLVVTSACLLFLSPGLFLSLALGSAKSIGQWVLTAFALSLVIISTAAGITQSITADPLRGISFAGVVIGCSLGCFGILCIRISQGHSLTWPLKRPNAVGTLLSMVVIPLLLLITLTPKFYWETFNGDGAHAFESARLLLVQPLPFWPASAGEIASFPGITSMLFAFPASWFIRLFGEVEASARLPFLLYLVALYGAILAIVEHDRTKALALTERWLICLGLVVYALVVAFSATYNPYCADIALPATQDTLLMASFMGLILMFLMRDQRWSSFFICLTFISVPNGSLLIVLWLVSITFLWRPRPWRQVALSTITLIGCLAVAAIVPGILAAVHYPPPGQEHGVIGLLKRFAFLQLTDWHRIAFILLPSGIIPAVTLLLWRWQDQIGRALTLMTIVYFLFFYMQAHISLHHFVPVMMIPLVVFWRSRLVVTSLHRPFILTLSGLAGIAALLISLPEDFTPHMSGRLIGAAIEDRIGGYEVLDPSAFRRSEILSYLFPYAHDPSVPLESYGGSPLVWNYYSHRAGSTGRDVNYVIQRAIHPPPDGMRLIAQQDKAALYVRSDTVWESHRAIRPSTPAGSRVYAIPRGILFRSVPLESGPAIINVVELIESLGIDMDPILERLGVKR